MQVVKCSVKFAITFKNLHALLKYQQKLKGLFVYLLCTTKMTYILPGNVQVAQLSQRDRAAGWVSNRQKWKTGTERQYLWTL